MVCRFANGDETVEVVPAYAADGGGYWIPDPKNFDWMKAYPKGHNAYVNEVNNKHFGSAKKLARLAKVWKYKRNVPISSCYLTRACAFQYYDIVYVAIPLYARAVFQGSGLKHFRDAKPSI